MPLCESVNENSEQICFLRHRKKFIWENRDFNVASKAVLDYIKNVVLFGREKKRTCEEVKENLPQNFVLYNVWCSKTNRWHLGWLNGEEACVHGTGYPTTKNSSLFDTRDECCATFTGACETEVESNEEDWKSAPLEMALALFHDYHTISKERADLRKIRHQEKKERKVRRKMRKA